MALAVKDVEARRETLNARLARGEELGPTVQMPPVVSTEPGEPTVDEALARLMDAE